MWLFNYSYSLEERGVEEEEYGGVQERRRKFVDRQVPAPRK